MGTVDSIKSILTQYALNALCEKYDIPDTVHPKLPGHNDRIRNSPADKTAAAKVSHFKIMCHVNGFVLTVEMDLFPFIHHADPTKPKRVRKKRKAADGDGGSGLPPKNLREDHATVPFVTSFVTPTPEREGGGHTDSITGPNVRTQKPAERSSVLDPAILTMAVATMVVSVASAPVPDRFDLVFLGILLPLP
nr:hypothetical protein [Tanacetum cinerariifolium]